jgi:Flp pilus assembly protein TadG
MRRIFSPLRDFVAARRAATALEFAMVAMPLMMLVIGGISFSYVYYLQFVLDYSLQQAVRQVQLGKVPSGTAASTYVASTMCPIFSQFASCTGLTITVQPVTDYWTNFTTVSSSSTATSFCMGQAGTLMYARATYQAPVWASFMVVALPPSPASSGQNVVSAAAFANENPAGTTITGVAGC